MENDVFSKYSKDYGLVVSLDFLGVKSLKFEGELIEWLKKRDLIIQKIAIKNQKEKDQYVKDCNDLHKTIYNEEKFYDPPDIKVQTFQDNVVMSFSLKKYGNRPENIIWIRKTLAEAFKSALEEGLMVRGSVSLGEYIHDLESTTMVGPAVNEVMSYCEVADWAGIIFCPSCTKFIDDLFYRNQVSKYRYDLHTRGYFAMKTSFIKYNTPVSNKTKRILEIKGIPFSENLYCLGWPYEFQDIEFRKFEKKHPRSRNITKNKSLLTGPTLKSIEKTLKQIKRDSSNPDVEKKYTNTYYFAEYCLKKSNYVEIVTGQNIK